jgi:hypothetical protein
MSILSGGNKKDKKGAKGAKNNLLAGKGNIKGGKPAPGVAKKPVKTGGTRGS